MNWLRSLRSQQIKPDWFVIEDVPEHEWQDAEKFWICYFRGIGCPLVNATEGGDAPPTPSPETRAKLREAWKHRPPVSAETRAKLSSSNMGKKYRLGIKNKHPRQPPSLEVRQKISEAAKGKKRSDKFKADLAKRQTGTTLSEETKEKIRQKLIGRKVTWAQNIAEGHRRRRERLRVIA